DRPNGDRRGRARAASPPLRGTTGRTRSRRGGGAPVPRAAVRRPVSLVAVSAAPAPVSPPPPPPPPAPRPGPPAGPPAPPAPAPLDEWQVRERRLLLEAASD